MSSRTRRGIAREWPLVVFVVCLQIAAGGAVAAAVQPASRAFLTVTALAFVCVGAAASLLHLGRPLAAWRSLINLRQSPVSREVAAMSVFAVMLIASALRDDHATTVVSACAGIAAVVASSAVYLFGTDSVLRRLTVVATFVFGAASFALVALAVTTTQYRVPLGSLGLLFGAFAAVASAKSIEAASRRFGCKGLRQSM